jgi:predicted nicotinamide N-methyase
MSGTAYKTKESKEILNVLELGSGTGIVGTTIGSLVKRCNLVLTDLPATMDVLNETIDITGIEAFDSDESDSDDEYDSHRFYDDTSINTTRKPTNPEDAEYKEVNAKVLEWQEDASKLPDCINSTFHVIVVADCTYNPDNYPKLISTLKAITDKSPKAIIMYASKQRHEDESKFEKMLEENAFFVKQAWQDAHLGSEQTIDIKTVIRKSPSGENWASEPPSWIPYHPLEGFWWSPKEISSDPAKKGFLRTMYERRLPEGEESWTEIFSMGRSKITPQ